MKQGMIVLLNGTSSSGKTSISNELLAQKDIVFHHLSVDDFIKDFFNNKFLADTEPAREIAEQTIMEIMFDPINSLYYATVKLYSEMGLNVVVDTVIDNDKWFNDCLDAFNDHPTLLIGVMCSKEELIRREEQREDRNIGLAASQFNQIYSIDEYDVEVNTEELTPSECADKILCFLKSNQDFVAFKKLGKRNVKAASEGACES